ncbi:MAG: HEAT repeat domain-containing protein [Phycisphaerales bacterium]|nr:HEAT repeat domain-containing protein [Phycisphaerales bacterium]
MRQVSSASWLVRRAGLFGVAAGVAFAGAASVAQSATPSQRSPESYTNEQLLSDFIHYVKIDQRELARSFLQALIDRGLTGEQLLGLVEDTPLAAQRFDEAIRDAMRMPELEGLAARLFTGVEAGRRDRARNPAAITESIGLLDDNQRARLLARERLAFAGEYAVPQLVEALRRTSEPIIQAEAAEMLVAMGTNAVAPLSAALTGSDPAMQEQIARILGRIKRPEAAPYLAEVAEKTSVESTRNAAKRALDALGVGGTGAGAAAQYVGLAEAYYAEPRSLTRFAGEDQQLLWNFEPGIGLFATPVATEVFHEAMAMRLIEHALTLDPNAPGAPSLWIAANFSRELDQPEGYDNPVYGSDRRGAMYYAIAAGSTTVGQTLRRALDTNDTALARLAIEALGRTLGTWTWSGSDEEAPLALALSYPDRRVQFEAALALASARPAEPFPGSDRVAPTLAAAIRDAGQRFALVVAGEMERQQWVREALESAGYTVLPPASSLAGAADAVSQAPGVDLIVSDLLQGQTEDLIREARGSAKLRTAPIVALLAQGAYSEMLPRFQDDARTRIARSGLSAEQLLEASRAVSGSTLGAEVDEAGWRAYSLAALAALRDIAVSGSRAFNIADAQRPLMSALGTTQGQVRLDVAEALAHIADADAQASIVEAALAASGAERIALLGKAAESARRHGNLLPERLVRRVEATATSANDAEATAGAALMGALDLAGGRIVPLILSESGKAR